MRSPSAFLLAALLLSGVACAPEPAPADPEIETSAPAAPAADAPEDYASEVRDWQEERAASLLEPGGWLSLVGLHWLEPGANTFGAAPENDLVFPEGAPDRAGTLHRAGSPGDVEARVEAAPGVELRRAAGAGEEGLDFTVVGEPVAELELAADTTGEPTVLALGSLRFWVIERGDRVGVRVVDLESPALAGFEGLEYFPVDPAWRVEARLEPEEGATVAVPNVLGQVDDLRAPGTLVFEHPETGEELRLTPTQDEPGDDLFLVFGDATNRGETYGGGRFLYADPPDAAGRVTLDFNRAYNPPCAFTPYATCPLPPEPNKLAARIDAGERRYAGEVPH